MLVDGNIWQKFSKGKKTLLLKQTSHENLNSSIFYWEQLIIIKCFFNIERFHFNIF